MNANRGTVGLGSIFSPAYGPSDSKAYRLTHPGGDGAAAYLYVDYHVENHSGVRNAFIDPLDHNRYWRWW
jgi:hypothetical protein